MPADSGDRPTSSPTDRSSADCRQQLRSTDGKNPSYATAIRLIVHPFDFHIHEQLMLNFLIEYSDIRLNTPKWLQLYLNQHIKNFIHRLKITACNMEITRVIQLL